MQRPGSGRLCVVARRSGAQRARGDGSVYRDGPGWRWAITLPDGTRARGRASTKDLAAAALRTAQRDIDDGKPRPTRASAITVGEWVTHVIDTNPRIRPRTRAGYRSKHRTLIVPHLGGEKVTRLRPERVEQWLLDLERAGSAAASRRQAFAVLAKAMAVAQRRGMIRSNPCEAVEAPVPARMPPTFFSVEEARAILATAKTTWNGARWAVAFAIGLRPGEALGLAVGDVDLDAGRITVRRVLGRVPYEHGCPSSSPCAEGTSGYRCPQGRGGGLGFDKPKSAAGVRSIAIPPPLVPLLREHLRARARQQLKMGTEWRESGLLFVREDGSAVPPEWDWRSWRPLLAAAGVTYRRPYDARHTAATFLAAAGVVPRVAMEILGHSQISLTQHVYTHVMDTSRKAAADAIGGVLWEQLPGAAGTGRGRTRPVSAGRKAQRSRGNRT